MHIQLQGIHKRFGDIQAVREASLSIAPGRVLALLGENGAGKSTLMKLLYGVHKPDSGLIDIDGAPAPMASPREAIAAGIGMVFQQFSLAPALTVRENLALALDDHESSWWTGRHARRHGYLIDAQLAALAPEVNPEVRVSSLPVGRLQLVELAKVMLRQARCVILDEPSAVLTPAEAQGLWIMVRKLAAQGVAIVLITHKLADVRACADDVAVMRAGRVIAQTQAGGASDAQIIEWMVGHAPRVPQRLAAPQAKVRIELKGVSAGRVRGVSLQVHAGEVLGVAGISGGGQTELAEAIAGALALMQGEVVLDGELLRAPRLNAQSSPASNAKLGYIPAEPLHNAVAADLSLAVNLALKRITALPWRVRARDLLAEAEVTLTNFDVRPAIPTLAAGSLSGGNLQKLVVARELSGTPAVVVACYPTMGLDVQATAQVYETLFALARSGSAVFWISEDLEDLLRHAHRIAVMVEGRIVRVVDAGQASLQEIGAWMTGGTSRENEDGARGQVHEEVLA